MRTVIYIRVSTKEQLKSLSLDVQREFCERYCEVHDLTVDRVFVERGESAKTTARTEFQRLLRHCRENKVLIHFVVVYKLDRFARDTADHLHVRKLLLGYGTKLRSATETIDETSDGRLMETMLSGFAQYDNDRRSERTIAGMAKAHSLGRWIHQPPIGYAKGDKSDRSQPSLVEDNERGQLVRLAFEKFSTGRYSVREALDRVNAMGLRTRRGNKVSPQSFGQMLRNETYAGWFKSSYTGDRMRGDWQPLVPEGTFQQVQAVLAGLRPTVAPRRRRHPDFPLRRFVRCGACEGTLTGGWSKGKGGETFGFYNCHNSSCKKEHGKVSASKAELEDGFVNLLRQLEPTPRHVTLFREVVLDVWSQRQAESAAVSRKLGSRVSHLTDRKDRLLDARIDGDITQQDYQRKLDQLNEDITLAQLELNEATHDQLDVEGVLAFGEHLLLNAARLWQEFSLDQRQRFQQIVFPEGLVFDGLSREFRTPVTCPVFSYLKAVSAGKESVASLTGFEPVSLA